MNQLGFSLIEVLVALMLLSAFMLISFESLQHFYQLEQWVQQAYQTLNLLA